MSGDEELVFGPEDPSGPEALALLEAHLAFARSCTPEGHVHALDVSGLQAPDVLFRGARRASTLLAVGALRDLGEGHFEVKSMHTSEGARGRGLGRAMLEHLVALAEERGGARVSLETGTMDAFAPARGLYAAFGFAECEPFGAYWSNPNSVCMTRTLRARGS